MKKNYTLKEIEGFKKISSLAGMYIGKRKQGVSVQYIKELIADGKINTIKIDGSIFIDIDSLPDEIKKNLKK
jgi:hypothetical protein